MSRINTNVSSLIAQRVLKQQNDALNLSLNRLSTGLKINSGADNPAGLIASENLRAEKAGLQQAIDNAGRASNIIGIAEGGLNEVSNLLTQLQSLTLQAANSGGLSSEELDANQLQVDSILNTINRIAGTTSFQGTKLLNGNYAYTASSAATSAFATIQINAAQLPAGATQAVVVNVTNSASTGEVAYTATASSSGSGFLAGGNPVTLEIAGNNGTVQLSFAASTSIANIETAINAVKSTTGVSAHASGVTLKFDSTGFGSDQYVSVSALSGTFSVSGGTAGKAFGNDAAVTVNGATATAKGKEVTYRSGSLDIEFTLTNALNAGQSKTFGITGGGAQFALGSKVSETEKAYIGIQSVSTGSLGDTSLGFLSTLGSGQSNALSSTDLSGAQKIVEKAIKQVSSLRGRLGAFQKFTINSSVNNLSIALENTSAADSAIRDTDFAQETANLTRSQILSQAAATVLAQANSAPSQALSLLRAG